MRFGDDYSILDAEGVCLFLITHDTRPFFLLKSRMNILKVCLTQDNCKAGSPQLVWAFAAQTPIMQAG